LLFTMRMKAAQDTSRRMQILFHIMGLSSLGGAIFLQALVFTDILQRGYFMAVEHNPIVLMLEIALTVFALVYFGYTYQRFLRSIR